VRDLSILPRAMRTYFRLWQKQQLTLRVSMGLDIPDVTHSRGDAADLGRGVRILAMRGCGSTP
jgi:hypothetical protein